MRIKNQAFGWLAAVTATLLVVPVVATAVSDSVNWSWADFIVAAVMVLLAGTAFILIGQYIKPARKGWLMAILVLLTLLLWAELAVGLFFQPGM